MRREERHHLKENPLAVLLADLQRSFVDRGRIVVVGAIVVVVALLAAGGFVAWQERQTQQAGDLLAEAMVVMSAGGLLFGFWGGTLFGTLGFSAGAALAFGTARGLGRDFVEGRLHGRLAKADAFLRQRGPRWLGLYTAIPFSVLTVVHAAAGLSSMRARSFLLWVTLGLVPRSALYSFFGDALVRDASRIWLAVGVLVVAIGVGAIVGQRMLRRERHSRQEPDEPSG